MNIVTIITESGKEREFKFNNATEAFKFIDECNPGDKMNDGEIIKSIKLKAQV